MAPSTTLPLHEGIVQDTIRCPITLSIMRDPVVAADGFTYERSAIECWLQTSNTSPMTNMCLAHKLLSPNISIKIMCQAARSS
ncbi:hypothetical protein WJX72_009911 [[Myrmecia] bisecta]|uniref:U-box domain-containing protein n=1 Tax=[Myrmecia] bisecta TaxID=41462 RepID=A0AAW1PM23_9CHLO